MVANISAAAQAFYVNGLGRCYRAEEAKKIEVDLVNNSSKEIEDTYTPSSGNNINDKYYGVYADFLDENKNNPDIMNNLYDKIKVQKLENPVQAYFDEHNIDVEAEYKKYMTKSGVDNDEDLKALATTPYRTRTELDAPASNNILSFGIEIEETAITREDTLQLFASSSVADYADIVRDHGAYYKGMEGSALSIKDYFNKLISGGKLDEKMNQKLTAYVSALSEKIENGTLGTSPEANIQKHNSSLISKYAN